MTNQLDDAEDTYTLSVLSFALKKAGDTSTTVKLLDKLDRKAIRKGKQNIWLISVISDKD